MDLKAHVVSNREPVPLTLPYLEDFASFAEGSAFFGITGCGLVFLN